MSDQEAPRNRKERRAAAKASGQPMMDPTNVPKVKMAQPDRSKPQGKTMLDLYEEKKSLLDRGQPFDNKYKSGEVYDEGGNILNAGLASEDGEDEPVGPLGEAIFWAASLGMIHFTLDVLVYNQYRQEIEWVSIFKRTGLILPILFFLIYMLGSQTAKRFETVRQIFFLTVAVAAGCYLIHAGNRYGYYKVMKQAPPLGTLWIWSVIEMKLAFAVVSVVADVGFMWWKGYSAF